MALYFVALSQSACGWTFALIFVFQGQAICSVHINWSAVVKNSGPYSSRDFSFNFWKGAHIHTILFSGPIVHTDILQGLYYSERVHTSLNQETRDTWTLLVIEESLSY